MTIGHVSTASAPTRPVAGYIALGVMNVGHFEDLLGALRPGVGVSRAPAAVATDITVKVATMDEMWSGPKLAVRVRA